MKGQRYTFGFFCTVAVLLGAGFGAPAQSLDDAAKAKWADELTKETGNPPERGLVPLRAFEAGTKVDVTTGPKLNRYLSLLITDLDTVNRFSFAEVMGQLAKQSSDQSFEKEMLFRQWWDTANKKPGLLLGPHCDDVSPTDQPYECPRTNEGAQALSDTVFDEDPRDDKGILTEENPAKITAYTAVAVSNRFDLLSPPQDAGNGLVKYPDCGEYRIIFALNAGRTIPASLASNHQDHAGDILNRNLISFEFRVKNPHPDAEKPGIPRGCMPILKFFYGLSATSTAKKRGELLHDFFMSGVMKTPDDKSIGRLPWPIVDIWNLSFGLGQIRTNQFMNTVTNRPAVPPDSYGRGGLPADTKILPNDWVLREFRTLITGKKVLKVLIVPVTTKSTPRSALFKTVDPNAIDPRISLLLDDIRMQTASLLGGRSKDPNAKPQLPHIGDINYISFSVLENRENAFASDAGSPIPCPPGPGNSSPCRSADTGQGDILHFFDPSKNDILSRDILDDLHAAGADLKAIQPVNVIDRIRTQTCAGCHQFSDTKIGQFGFDDPKGLGGGAVWPTKACGDYAPDCALPKTAHPTDAFFIKDPKKLHPPMQFTQVSEGILIPSAADAGQGWRYAISSTAECMLDYREKVMESAGFPVSISDHCSQK